MKEADFIVRSDNLEAHQMESATSLLILKRFFMVYMRDADLF